MNDSPAEQRRAVLFGLLSVCIAPHAHAQLPSRASRIGILEVMPPEVFPGRFEAFKEGLRAAGYADGTVQLVSRSANGRLDRLPALAAELVSLDVDLILAATTAAAVAARDATKRMPIVFAVVADPIGAGLVESLSRPGGNLTGLTTINTDVAQKRLQLLRDLLNVSAPRVALVFNPGDQSNVIGAQLVREAGRILGLEVSPMEVRGREDLERAFVRMTSERADGAVVAAGALTDTHGRLIIELAARTRIPAMYGAPEFVEAGGLISYSASFSSNYRRAAVYADRILRGTSPARLPVEQSSELELVINRRTAASLGLAVPPSLLVQARIVG
jgi:putative ABC transport system substrate-binding protein